jgi:GDP-L-fucose synthase
MCAAYNRQFGTNFISVMPTNLYGPGDNYDLETSHVLPALIRKMHEAKQGNAQSVTVWGSGNPRRELLYSDDMVDACLHLLERFSAQEVGEFVNIGVGKDISIAELAALVREIVGFSGNIVFDRSKPDGMPLKMLDVSRLAALGWRSRVDLRTGIASAYADFLERTRSSEAVTALTQPCTTT